MNLLLWAFPCPCLHTPSCGCVEWGGCQSLCLLPKCPTWLKSWSLRHVSWLSQGQSWLNSFCPLLSCLETLPKQTNKSLHIHITPFFFFSFVKELLALISACTTDPTVGDEGRRILTRGLPQWYLSIMFSGRYLSSAQLLSVSWG